MTNAPVKTRLALVITELEVGGAERCLANLALGLAENGAIPAVFALDHRPKPNRDALVVQLEKAAIPVHFLGCSNKWHFASAVRSLRRALEQFQPHIIQSMLFHANVVTQLALPPPFRSRWCAGIRVADPSRVRQLIERNALRRAERVVCVSRKVADLAAARLKVPTQRICVIPNGVDTQAVVALEPADLAELGVPRSQRAITCVARLAPQKGIDLLLRAAPRVLSALPGHDLLLVGDGPQAGELRQMANGTAVANRIHFCGWQPNPAEILLASDLLVLPSRWEGMPNVLLEAMACSRPVVCTRVEGVVQVLGPLAAHQTAPVDDAQVLSDKIVAILQNAQLAAQLGADNRARVAAQFSLKSMLDQYKSLYSTLPSGLNED